MQIGNSVLSAYYTTSVGVIRISYAHNAVCGISVVDSVHGDNFPSELSDKAASQIKEYLSGKRTRFDFDYSLPDDKSFKGKVLNNLISVPYGKVITYKRLAEISGSPRASRAVGNAVHSNPLFLIIPCHRVVGSNGSLTGYAGGIHIKMKLLELEGVDLSHFFVPKKGTAL